MNIKPLADRCVLKMLEAADKTPSGIILSSGSKEKPQLATVIAVGPGNVYDGKPEAMYVKEGDIVIVSNYAGQPVKLEDEDYTIVRQTDILGIVEGFNN